MDHTMALLRSINVDDVALKALNISSMEEADLRVASKTVVATIVDGKVAIEGWMKLVESDGDLSELTTALRDATGRYLGAACDPARTRGAMSWSDDGPTTPEERRECLQIMAVLAAARRGNAEGWSSPLDALPACANALREFVTTAMSDNRNELRYHTFKPHS